LSSDPDKIAPTVTDNLFTDGTISENVLSISFEPITDSDGTQLNGEMTWGVCIYYLESWTWILKFLQVELTLASTLAPSPTRKHMAIVFFKYINLSYKGLLPPPLLQATTGVSTPPWPTGIPIFYQPLLVFLILVRSNGVDKISYTDRQWYLVGTSLILIATDAFKKYQSATGGVPDKATSLLTISSDQFANLKSIFVNVQGVCVLYHGSVAGSVE
jgi:cathepsin E